MVGGSIKSYLLKRVSTVRIRPGAPEEYRARYRYGAGLFWSKGRIRTVDTRVTHFPAGGVFESARGHQKIITASRERRRFWFVGAADGLGPSTPASPISPRGGSFRISPGTPEIDRARYTVTVPGSSGSCHVKNEAPACWGSKRAPVSEYVCGGSRNGRWGGD